MDNSFANPYPYISQIINSFIGEYLLATNKYETIEQYGLKPFSLNILDKRRTMIEKLVSLVRFSFSVNPVISIASKIRHFYDLYFIANDPQCAEYIQSEEFLNDFKELLIHDQLTFDEPKNWQTQDIENSPLITDFPALWEKLKTTYQNELSLLAFTSIPDEKEVAKSFIYLLSKIARTSV